MDRLEDTLNHLSSLQKKLHLCTYCQHAFDNDCKYAERMSKAIEILEEIGSKKEEEIVNRLGANPYAGEYLRITYDYGPIVKCDSYEGDLEGNIWNTEDFK